MKRALANLAVLAALATARGAEAQATSSEARAVELFERSEVAYNAGRYEEAIDLLNRAYELKPDPVLLHNIGVAWEAEKAYPRAVQAFERCLREYPTYGRCAQRLETARAAAAADADAARTSPMALPAPSSPPPSETTPMAPWPWLMTGIGVAGIAAGGVLTFVAARRSDDAQAAASAPEAQSIHSTALGYQTAGTVAFVAGGVVAVVGATWLVMSLVARQARRAPSVQIHREP
jgi:tetratricopeptide (TPR) repeat protein